jgi:hypothetical protein
VNNATMDQLFISQEELIKHNALLIPGNAIQRFIPANKNNTSANDRNIAIPRKPLTTKLAERDNS